MRTRWSLFVSLGSLVALFATLSCGGATGRARDGSGATSGGAGGDTTTVVPWAPPAARDTHDDPDKLRPGYGNTELHTWYPLTDAEVTALRSVDKARQGDWHALLALAILASGDKRDAASYARYDGRVAKFVADVQPTLAAAADDWHRGYELNRQMHRVFFNEQAELGGYVLSQGRVTQIFETGRYNCLSSALLYMVLARAVGLTVRGVLVPTHAFIEMGPPGGKVIEVETTSSTGFDWVHDAKFYREQAAGWSSARGMRPVTLEEYQKRQILEPHRFVAAAMNNGLQGKTQDDTLRLAEVSALVDPSSTDALHRRLAGYNNEGVALFNLKASRTMVKLGDTVLPWLNDAAKAAANDLDNMQWIAWVWAYYAMALPVVGRTDEAIALVDRELAVWDDRWNKADGLKGNLYRIYQDRMLELMTNKDFEAAAHVMDKRLDGCRADRTCGSNLSVVYRNWAGDKARVGDWPATRDVLRQCLAALPDDAGCKTALAEVESRHQL
jgi:tetratricopeptide (TPR) repeat protein